MDENEMLNIFLPSTTTSNASIIKNEPLEPNLPKEDPQLSIVQHERVDAWPFELQLKSIKPEVKVEIVDEEDDISIKLDPVLREELHIKDENELTEKLIEANTESGYYCDFCNRKFSDKNILEQHLKPEIKPLECYKCDYKCIQKCVFEVHINTQCGQTPRAERSFNSTISNYKCVRKLLKRHMIMHTGEKPFNCDFCDYKTVQQSDLEDHLRTHTGEKPFKCAVCGFTAARKVNLQSHMRTHTGKKPFNCDICDFKAAYQRHLKDHLRTHTGEKPFKCAACGFTTACKANVQAHMKTHARCKSFNCNICDYKTVFQSHLKSHLRTHIGEKSFKCTACGFITTDKVDLQAHMEAHTGEKPFKCSDNGYTTSHKSDLRSHMNTHSGETVQV